MMKATNPVPQTPDAWLIEISQAYKDAKEAIPFGVFVGQTITENDLFHLAPRVSLKFRGLHQSKKDVDKATEAVLASYVASTETAGEELSRPQMAFAFCYLASHYALGLISNDEASRILDFVENQKQRLNQLIESKAPLHRRRKKCR